MTRPPDTAKAPAGAWGSCTDQPKGNWQQDRQPGFTPSLGSAQPQLHRHHADSSRRRPKTLDELLNGHEFVELADRASPAFLSGRWQR
jgi:hypothetical protein